MRRGQQAWYESHAARSQNRKHYGRKHGLDSVSPERGMDARISFSGDITTGCIPELYTKVQHVFMF